jgi:hypothetical protein
MAVTPVAQVDTVPPASMIRYAGIFLAAHFCGVLLVGTLIRVVGIPRPPWLGLWIIVGAAYLVSYIFARRRRRIFTSGEKWRLVSYCSAYLVIFELYAEFSTRWKIGTGSVGPSIDNATSLAIAAIGCLVDILILVLLFEFGAPRLMRSYIQG